MTDNEADTTTLPPRERPWLLPYNRKFRHLHGLTIRNLTLVPPEPSSHPRTIDDDALPSTLKSPSKALAQREARALSHSRSSSDLQAAQAASVSGNGERARGAFSPRATRPSGTFAARRRSTMDWSGASPQMRQQRLEDLSDSRMADTFFSLHVDGLEEPIYISEVVEKATNPTFRFFDISPSGPGVTRADAITVKVWANSKQSQGWQHLIEWFVHFRALEFVGKTLGHLKNPLPHNCILFHMTDGIYTSFTDLPTQAKFASILAPPKVPADGRILKTSSYDALMRLSTLDDCIQDALTTRDRLAEDIETVLEKHNEAMSTVEHVPEARDRLRMVEAAVVAERRRVEAVRKRRKELEAAILYRKERMEAGRQLQQQMEEQLDKLREDYVGRQLAVAKTEEDIAGQRRRVCEDLLRIFPMEPVTGKALLFSIRGLALPNGDFEDGDEAVISAALGHVALVVTLLSAYLGVLLPYPINVVGSTSTIDDPLAMNTAGQKTPSTFPLFMKGVVRFRFEYGVFLLNKDIEALSHSLGLVPLDLRHTLPNLKYLLYVATAGKGELPARKAGGVKGLLRRDGALSRAGSFDSNATRSSADLTDVRGRLQELVKKSEACMPQPKVSKLRDV